VSLLRDDRGRLRAGLRGVFPAVVTLLAFIAGLVALGAAFGTTETITPTEAVAVFLAQLVLYAALTAAAVWLAAGLERSDPASFGLAADADWLRNALAGAAISIAGVSASLWWGDWRGLRSVDLGNAGVEGAADPLAVAGVLAAYVGFFLAGNVYEEVVYRRIAIRNFAAGLAARGRSRRTAVALATVASLALFGLYHVPLRGGVVVAADAALVGVTFALPYLLTGDLSLAVGVHFGRLPTVFMTGRTVAGIEVAPVVELTETTLASNLEVRLLQIGVVCLLTAGWHLSTGGSLAVADSVTEGRTDPGETD
jgi:membrane protease YdiL (CAAX protease family)